MAENGGTIDVIDLIDDSESNPPVPVDKKDDVKVEQDAGSGGGPISEQTEDESSISKMEVEDEGQGQGELDIKQEVKFSGDVGGAEGKADDKSNSTNTVEVEVKVKSEVEMDGRGCDDNSAARVDSAVKVETLETVASQEGTGDSESYMVVEDVEDSDNEQNLEATNNEDEPEEGLTENELLRRSNAQLSERLAVLEEFIEIEFGEKFESFLKKRERLVDVMGLKDQDGEGKISGKRPSKSLELVGILKLAKDQPQPKPSTSNGNATSSQRSRSTRQTAPKSNKTPYKDDKNKSPEKKHPSSSGPPPPDMIKRCHRCRKSDHLYRDCPYKSYKTSRDAQRQMRKEKKQKQKKENELNPELGKLRGRRRRINRVINRMRQKKDGK